MKQSFMKHPAPVQIALFSGGDLSGWERWRVSRHVARCAECRAEVASLRDSTSELRALADDTADLPRSLNWNRLAEEMTGNIRVGLAAGEAIAQFDKPRRAASRVTWFKPGWSAGLVALGATLIFAVAFWTSLPPQQAEHLMTAFNRIRVERIGRLIHSGAAATASPEDVVLEASSSGIQVRENGRAMSLIPRSDGATVSVSMHGSAGVRYVDTDTGQVTTTKVYYAEQ
jgi:anti-sigma factor RsiW